MGPNSWSNFNKLGKVFHHDNCFTPLGLSLSLPKETLLMAVMAKTQKWMKLLLVFLLQNL
jgi:hypothetical protein